MNISEAVTWQRVAAFLRGEVDHCDEGTRQKLAHDLTVLDIRSQAALHAGTITGPEQWDELLCNVTFEAP